MIRVSPAVVALICPIAIAPADIGIALIFGLRTLVCTFPACRGLIPRRRGVFLLVPYGLYLAAVLYGPAA